MKVLCPRLGGHQLSLTSTLALAPLVLGRAAPVPHSSFSDTVQGKEHRKAWTESVIHLLTVY